ncbi:MAG: hypothetical protein ACHQ0J_05030 [Candidatus Dormibacterales bacterium]
MEWTAVILAAVIGALAAFTGGYFGSRWQAESELAQWRRDQLLQICADVLAAGPQVMDSATDVTPTSKPPWPSEPVNRLMRAGSTIRLLSEDLYGPASAYSNAILAFLSEARATGGKSNSYEKGKALGLMARAFADAARQVLMRPPQRSGPVQTAVAKVKGIATRRDPTPPSTGAGGGTPGDTISPP